MRLGIALAVLATVGCNIKMTKAGTAPYAITTDYEAMRNEVRVKYAAATFAESCDGKSDANRCGYIYQDVLAHVSCTTDPTCKKQRLLALKKAFDERYAPVDSFDVADRCASRCDDPELWEMAVMKSHTNAVNESRAAELAAVDEQERDAREGVARQVRSSQQHLQRNAFAGAAVMNARRTGQPIVLVVPAPVP